MTDLLRGVRTAAPARGRRRRAAAAVLRALAAVASGLPPGAAAGRAGAALEESARVNAAYRALRDPIARVEYLIRLEEGRETREGAAVKPKAPPELLAEMFEIQESAGGGTQSDALDDADARPRSTEQRDGLRARMEDAEARLAGPLSQAWDAAAAGRSGGGADRAQGSAGHAGVSADRDRRPRRRTGRGTRGDACRASSGLTSARPTASSPTWTTGPGCRVVIPDRDGRRLLPSIVSVHARRHRGGRGGAAAARAPAGRHRLLGQAADGPRLGGRQGRAALPAVPRAAGRRAS